MKIVKGVWIFLTGCLRPWTGFIPVLAILLFLGAMFWAKGMDPFARKWLALRAADGDSFQCVAVLLKPVRRCPAVIYAHGRGGSLTTDGNDLRQLAGMGLAAVSLEYDQSNGAAFSGEMAAVLKYLQEQSWADTNCVAWVGFSQGTFRTMDYAWQHPEEQPRVLVELSGGLPGAPPAYVRSQVWLIHGDQDEVFPGSQAEQLGAELQTNGTKVEIRILPGLAHNLEPERGVIFREIGEKCLVEFHGTNAWRDYHSTAQWQAEAPGLVWFWIPAGLWLAGGLAWRSRSTKVASIKLERHEVVLRWIAAALAIWAAAVTVVHLAPPQMRVTEGTLAVARKYLVPPKERDDFEALARQPIWQGVGLKVLLQHAGLAGYNRELINWQLDDGVYRDYVLQPVITGRAGERLDWRRPLWEEFYPRVRHEVSPADAAAIVVRHLRERVTVAEAPGLPREVPEIWLRQITDRTGFEIVYVAALRSVGVPARLNGEGKAEFYDGLTWRKAPMSLELE